MPVTDSPLRYPGGKTKIYDRVKKIIDDNMLKTERIYVEPYASGAGLALKLLYKGDVQKLVLNDFDYHIFCFWHVCLQETDILEYKGNFYLIGEGHKPFMADKVLDEDYLILTMAGLAKELRKRNKTDGRIILAVGLPITCVNFLRDFSLNPSCMCK